MTSVGKLFFIYTVYGVAHGRGIQLSSTSGISAAQDAIKKAGKVDEQYLQRLMSDLAAAKIKLDEGRAASTAMLNSLGEGLVVTDEQGQITTVNSYALRCLGFAEHELIGKWLPKVIIAVDQFGRPLNQLTRPSVRALTTGQTVSDSIYYLTSLGEPLPVHVTVSPIMVGDTPTGAIEVFQDLTREHQLDIAKNEFVSLASHQLRTPATGMKSILSMLGSGDFGALTPLQQKYVDKAMQTNDRQLQIIEDLLNVALVDAGKLELDLDFADLSSVLQDVVSDHAAILENRSQSIRLSSPGTVRMLMDVQKSRMVFDNLISNASKYSPEGGTIQVNLRPTPEIIEISVRDEGVGIPQDEIVKLFTKFTRISNELSASVGGTGLGLFLTKSIVELHGGTIRVASKENCGSTFTVCLPTNWRHTNV
jgi:two-component system sensor histidine kinase VicK